ncbi:MAG: NAD-dependent succinate-semialdehyde dehydrogenase [Dehalococcoidia bacterium]|nr:NAD-dependent succinate-semialdehyde dehydrogenase [Dehalococcoidia bacterium]
MAIKSVNPATGEVVKEYDCLNAGQIEDLIERSGRAFAAWRESDMGERTELLRRAARILREGCRDYARLMAVEMGKPVAAGRAEIEKCAWACEYYADNAARFLERETVETEASSSYVRFQPLGVILAVMPWNFPFWQVFRFAAPAVMAGNCALLKHSSNVPGCAIEIEAVFRRAGFPEGVFATLLAGSDAVAGIIRHQRVRGVTLTGGTPAGSAVAAEAGKMIKKTVLELGGNDPYIVLEDADLEIAVNACAGGRLANTGQSCIAPKRLIVVQPRVESFLELLVPRMSRQRLGDPLDETTTVGPLARLDIRDELHRQVTESIEKGARRLLGGNIPGGHGAFYPPTVLTDVRKGMPAFDEELFGPVAAVVPVRDEEEAVAAANDSRFGLGAGIFTRDAARAERIAGNLDAGICFVNDCVRSDPRLPFGGVKDSGYGRELSHYGIREFVNIKAVVIR